jgi:hypothetical protein
LEKFYGKVVLIILSKKFKPSMLRLKTPAIVFDAFTLKEA